MVPWSQMAVTGQNCLRYPDGNVTVTKECRLGEKNEQTNNAKARTLPACFDDMLPLCWVSEWILPCGTAFGTLMEPYGTPMF